MARLEMIKLSDVQIKEVLKALLSGSEFKIEYVDKDKVKQEKVVVKNHRLFFGSNYSISLSNDNNKNVYMSVDYFDVDSRITLNKKNKDNLTIEEIDF